MLVLFIGLVIQLVVSQTVTNSNINRPDIYGLINILYIKADANLDQTITLAELGDVFHGFDKNGDGNVTVSEFVELWKALTGQTTELADAYFHLADITDDKVINQADYGLLYHVFDLNGDNKVTAQEFAKKWEDIIRETPFAVLFERADTNKDEFLSSTEFGHFFSSFDTNHNGHSSKAEFEKGWHAADFALLSDADQLFMLLDHNHDGSITAADMSHWFTQYDKNHNHRLDELEVVQMKSLLTLNTHSGSPTWKILLLSIIAVGINADQGQPEVNLFHKADTNNDYKLTRHELDDLFLEFDQNNDSIITPTEFVSDWTNFNIGGAQQAQALFTRADTNDDHVIDAKDIPAIFAFFDQNGDGWVDISEFLTQWGFLEKESNNTVNISVDVTG